MSFTVWESDESLEAAERAFEERPVDERRGIRPPRLERWIVEASL